MDPDTSLQPIARFLQISDLHLGAPMGWLPPEAREQRRRDQRFVLDAAVRAAIERRSTALLVPGDLFDRDNVDAETMAYALHAFDAPGCPPVFIAPGNHDPWSDASASWSPRMLQARGWTWPDHVHVFTSPQWTGWALAGSDVHIWGRAYAAGAAPGERPLASLPVLEGASGLVNVAVFHGSREGACPAWQVLTGPFSDDEARRAPFDYMAAGHYHVHSTLEMPGRDGARGTTRLAYAGSAMALDLSETGPHGALDVRIARGPEGVVVTTDFVALDPRKVFALDLEVAGVASADDVDRRVLALLDAAGVGTGDLASVRLAGRLLRGVRFGGPGPELSGRTFHLRIDGRRLRPDYDLEAYRSTEPVTTEERFARTLLEALDAETDPEARATIERALYYGLDAIRLGEVAPAYEGIGS